MIFFWHLLYFLLGKRFRLTVRETGTADEEVLNICIAAGVSGGNHFLPETDSSSEDFPEPRPWCKWKELLSWKLFCLPG